MVSRTGPASVRGGEDIDLLALSRAGTVHFVGICGAGMSALAELILRSGGEVSGCDARLSAVGDTLRRRGAEVMQGHDPSHVEDAVAVVATAAVPADHPELRAAHERGIPVLKRAAALGALVNQGTVLAIAGTHGKTTTTAMTTAILVEAGLDPTGFVGGRVPGWESGLRAGSDELFVVEADEYDRSFLTLRPDVAVVTTVEADHLEIYGSFAAVEAAFREFVAPVPEDGRIISCADDAGARRLLEEVAGERGLGYGLSPAATLRAVGIERRGPGSRFTLEEGGQALATIELGAPGLHNIRNALAAIAAARHVGAGLDAAARALADFGGVARRFQVLGEASGVVIVDDYAHHPTAVEATIEAAREAYPGRRLVVVFQPHLYTRTRDFVEEFGRSLIGADRVWVTDVFPARERAIPGVDGALVARAAEAAGVRGVRYEPELEQLADALASSLRAGDVCVTMGAGDIDETAHGLFARLSGSG